MKRIRLILVMVVIVSVKVSAQTAVNDTLKFSSDKKEISTFLNLMHIAGLDSVYSGKPVTIFAPDDKNFEKSPPWVLDTLLKPANQRQLIILLKSHCVSGKLTAKEIGEAIRQNKGQDVLTALSGNKLTAKINANRNITLTDESGVETIVNQFDIRYFNATFFITSSVILSKK